MSLYIKDPHADQYRLYCDADYPFEQSDFDNLRARGVSKLYVSHVEHRILQQYLRGNIDHLLEDESQPIESRFSVLNDVVRDVLGEAFESRNVQNTVNATKEISERMVDVINRTDAVASRLCAVLHHDYHTFTHTANVSYYCVMLAKALGSPTGPN